MIGKIIGKSDTTTVFRYSLRVLKIRNYRFSVLTVYIDTWAYIIAFFLSYNVILGQDVICISYI